MAGTGNPFYAFTEGPATQTVNGTIMLTLSWKLANGTAKTATVPITIPPGTTRTAAAGLAVTALNANTTIAADWTFAASSHGLGKAQTAEGTPTAKGTVACDPGVANDGTIPPAPATIPVTGLGFSGGVDPLVGTAYFDVFGQVSSQYLGEVDIGLEGLTVSTPTFVDVGGVITDKSILEIKNDLLSEMIALGFSDGFLDPSTGLLTFPDVTMGDPAGTNGSDVGPFFLTTDQDIGGFAGCEVCVPEPSSVALLLVGIAGVAFIRRRRGQIGRGGQCTAA